MIAVNGCADVCQAMFSNLSNHCFTVLIGRIEPDFYCNLIRFAIKNSPCFSGVFYAEPGQVKIYLPSNLSSIQNALLVFHSLQW